MIKPVFKNIQNEIQLMLFRAQKSIKISVAWFTNDLLFQPLLLKLKTGVSVELITNDDEINRGANNSVDFNLFIQSGGILHWVNDNKLMHQKFCIIDDNIVINGSYNWTNKAEHNYEQVTIFTDEQEVTKEYLNSFTYLTSKYKAEVLKPTLSPLPVAEITPKAIVEEKSDFDLYEEELDRQHQEWLQKEEIERNKQRAEIESSFIEFQKHIIEIWRTLPYGDSKKLFRDFLCTFYGYRYEFKDIIKDKIIKIAEDLGIRDNEDLFFVYDNDIESLISSNTLSDESLHFGRKEEFQKRIKTIEYYAKS